MKSLTEKPEHRRTTRKLAMVGIIFEVTEDEIDRGYSIGPPGDDISTQDESLELTRQRQGSH